MTKEIHDSDISNVFKNDGVTNIVLKKHENLTTTSLKKII